MPHLFQNAQKEGRAFATYKEMPIEFEPSYKYLNGSTCDYKEVAPLRTPSWCDRVLWHVKEGKSVGCQRNRKRDKEGNDVVKLI